MPATPSSTVGTSKEDGSAGRAAGVRSYRTCSRPGAVDQVRSLAQRGKPQAVRLFLLPFKACLFSEDTQAKIVLVSRRNLARPEKATSAFRKAQHDLHIVIHAAAGDESCKLGSQLPAIQAGDKRREIVSMGSNIPE